MPVSVEYRSLQVDGYSLKTVVKRNGQHHRPPLLIINGVGSSLQMLQPFLDNYRHNDVISFEAPKGKGMLATLCLWRMKKYAQLVAMVLDEFRIPAVNILGYSWGGALAQQFVRLYPERCNKLILAATSPGHLMVPGKVFFSLKVLSPGIYTSPKKLFELIGDAHIPEYKVKHANSTSVLSSDVYINQLMALTGWTSLLWLPRVKHPTLVLHAADDVLVSEFNAHILATLMPNARLNLYETGGHMFVFNQFERFVSDLKHFIDQ